MKMNKILVGLCFLSITLSCKKVLEIRDTDFIGGELAYATVENADQGAIGAYAATVGEGNMYVNGILSDELKTGDFPSDQTVHTWIYGADDLTLTRGNQNTYEINYRVIDRANRVLAALPEADSMRAGDNALRSRLRGEMLAIRAFMHFELARWYTANYAPTEEALPYMKTSSLGYQARVDMKTYYDNIVADLAEARTLLPATFTDVYRINRTAVMGMQARVALYMRNWAAAEQFASDFITVLPLATKAQFPNIWRDSSNAEIAWKLRRTNLTLRPGDFFRGRSTNATTLGTILWTASSKLWDAYDQANDIRFTSYLKFEPLVTNAAYRRLVRKYEGTGYATTSENANDYKMFRTGEMYLIRAEARMEQDKVSLAMDDLNTLRAARINNYVNEAFVDKATFINALMNERFKELAFEGHRFWDLKRRGLPVERRTEDAPTAASVTLPANSFRFTLPIPFYEIQANKLIKQNSGY